MTPTELLDRVAANVRPVLYLDSAQTEYLLRKALEEYGERTAPTAMMAVEAPDNADAPVTATVPAGFDSVDMILDNRKRYRRSTVDADTGTLTIDETDGRAGPYRVWYFLDMATLDLETGELPAGSESIIHDYLDALIRLHNTERARTVAKTTGRDDEFPADSELRAEVQRIAEDMSDRHAILAPVMAGGGWH